VCHSSMMLGHLRRNRLLSSPSKSFFSTFLKDSFCCYCGTRHTTTGSYPRICPSEICQNVTYSNPLPVSVVLVPVEIESRIGLLVGKRNIEPQKGKLAFFGGFVEEEEVMKAGARELKEESGIEINPDRLLPFWFTSTEPKPNRVLLFSLFQDVIKVTDLPPFVPNTETSERGVIFGTQGLKDIMAFPLHIEATEKFFSSVRDYGHAGYTKC
jgi:8-oxo-dGTP diphosphatase